MINLVEHFAFDFQELKASTSERIDTMEHLIWENVMGQDTENMKQQVKQQVELLQNENNRLWLASESLLKVID